MPPIPAREALLDRCIEFLTSQGFSELSLRQIAAGVGTSHRMLLYHFGSREGLLTEVVNRVEAHQREVFAALARETADPIELGRRFWRRLTDPALAGAERLFFEVYAQALYGREWTESFRATVISAWAGPIEELFVHYGFSREEARARARLGIAATRGLLLDLLLTGDTEVLDEAAELLGGLLARPTVSATPPRSPTDDPEPVA
jgi:AcrR family transcriptional regulator